MLAGYGRPVTLSENYLLRQLQFLTLKEQKSLVMPLVALEYVPGWDISGWQEYIDWTQVTGLKYVFIKATEGISYVSSRYQSQWDGAGLAGQLRGAYHYHHTEISGKAQANYFLAHSDKGEIPSVIDVEDAASLLPNPDPRIAELAGKSVYEFVDTVSNARGQKVLVYTGKWFWDRLAYWARAVSANYEVFPATYRKLDDVGPILPTGWSNWLFWQWTSKGYISGVQGRVDLSVFHGDLEDFHSWLGSPPPPPTPFEPYIARVTAFALFVRTQPWYPAPLVDYHGGWVGRGTELLISEEVGNWGKSQYGWVNRNYIQKI